ncbi:uncharacterized protein PG986_002767 [Apiospora aurea]|uniref:Uncharacterized protein n=1 Tax=Apiospora aurea TaxID=335848 RepID=A0ABR1QPR6_9PEZI
MTRSSSVSTNKQVGRSDPDNAENSVKLSLYLPLWWNHVFANPTELHGGEWHEVSSRYED